MEKLIDNKLLSSFFPDSWLGEYIKFNNGIKSDYLLISQYVSDWINRIRFNLCLSVM